ncbi:lysophospholipid acyltransferase family protein [Pseudomonadales bacterium]|jgi:1-acyl-sn-glycerol-3-phosphate acyltransferase|nr:lysophospholipid acyltransferase family protein [Pseudomonadales bacterium]MDC3359006.1 1-acyl-sn-glycerol-3-phosphate acyltransferase [Pseudomonadales bacterium]
MTYGSEQILNRPTPKTGLYTAYKWVFVLPILVLTTTILGSLIIALSFLGAPDYASRVFGTLWAKINTKAALIGVQTTGKEHIKQGQSYVVVANHQSLLDIYLLYGYLGIDVKWVMKQELRAVPVLGLACEMMGHVIVDRSNTASALASMERARERIKDGMSVIFFAEGTRSRSGELKPFKKGAFRMAQELNLPILPITIQNTRHILPSDTIDLRPGVTRMTIGKPISVEVTSTTADYAKLHKNEPALLENSPTESKATEHAHDAPVLKSLSDLSAEVREVILTNLQQT